MGVCARETAEGERAQCRPPRNAKTDGSAGRKGWKGNASPPRGAAQVAWWAPGMATKSRRAGGRKGLGVGASPSKAYPSTRTGAPPTSQQRGCTHVDTPPIRGGGGQNWGEPGRRGAQGEPSPWDNHAGMTRTCSDLYSQGSWGSTPEIPHLERRCTVTPRTTV
jgi:hypothetical protein